MSDRFRWRGGEEAVLRLGEGQQTLLILPPLFEEANRSRRMLVAFMRALATTGVATLLPDLPGTGDSVVPTVKARLADWRHAVADLAAQLPAPRWVLAVRGGTLIDDAASATGHYRLAPETGARLLRDLLRSTAMGEGRTAATIEAEARARPTRLAGNLVDPSLFAALAIATPAPLLKVRTAQLGEGGDVRLPGVAPWRRAEPDEAPELGAALLDDLSRWMTPR